MVTQATATCGICGATGKLDIHEIDLRRVIGWDHHGPTCLQCRRGLRHEWRPCNGPDCWSADVPRRKPPKF